jgi:hypothetical protein
MKLADLQTFCKVEHRMVHRGHTGLSHYRPRERLFSVEKGGICVFLGEECCFYANQSGIVRETHASY